MLADGVGGKGRESCLIALSAALIVFSPRSGSLNRRTTVNERVYKTPRRVRELAKIPVRTEIVYAMRKRWGITGASRTTPRLGFQLYSIAGAKANASLEPESSRMLGGFCTRSGSRVSYPVARVLPLWRYVASSASTHLRVRLYSKDASTKRELPGFAYPRKPAPVP